MFNLLKFWLKFWKSLNTQEFFFYSGWSIFLGSLWGWSFFVWLNDFLLTNENMVFFHHIINGTVKDYIIEENKMVTNGYFFDVNDTFAVTRLFFFVITLFAFFYWGMVWTIYKIMAIGVSHRFIQNFQLSPQTFQKFINQLNEKELKIMKALNKGILPTPNQIIFKTLIFLIIFPIWYLWIKIKENKKPESYFTLEQMQVLAELDKMKKEIDGVSSVKNKTNIL